MKLYYLVTLDVDTAAIAEDNPPEDIRQAIGDEIMSSLQDSSVRDALGITGVAVDDLTDTERTHATFITSVAQIQKDGEVSPFHPNGYRLAPEYATALLSAVINRARDLDRRMS